MARTIIPFAIESAVSRALQLSAQRCVNMFVERQGQGSKAQTPLFGAPGLTAFATADTAPNRGSWNFNGQAYFVQGENLYLVSALGMSSLVGTGIQGAGPVSMSDNGVQICIVNGMQGYIYTVAGGLVQITSPAFYPARTVRFMDGYFIFDRAGTNEWFLSALFDGTSFNGLDFASAEGQPGFLTTTYQNLQLLFIFCSAHIEIWYDSGAEDFPFARYAGGIINYGCIAPFSVVSQDGALFFMGADKVFYRLQANVPVRVSTHPIEHILQLDPDLSQTNAITYTLEGHKMVAVTLPQSNVTLEFDISTQRWHDRESWTTDNVSLGIWRAFSLVEAYQRTLAGDAFGGQIGFIDWTTYTEYGNTIRGLVDSSPISKDRLRVFISNLELDIQAGVGQTNDPGADPKIMLQVSKDGGETWSLPQPARSMGKIGEYLTRCRWLALGQARQFVFRLILTDPVQRVIIGAYGDIEIGLN